MPRGGGIWSGGGENSAFSTSIAKGDDDEGAYIIGIGACDCDCNCDGVWRIRSTCCGGESLRRTVREDFRPALFLDSRMGPESGGANIEQGMIDVLLRKITNLAVRSSPHNGDL